LWTVAPSLYYDGPVSSGRNHDKAASHGSHIADDHTHDKPAAVADGVAQLEQMLWQGAAPTADAIAALLAEFPGDRDAIVMRLQQTFGNGFVQSVLKSERWSESMAQADERSHHGVTSLPPQQQRRHVDQSKHVDGAVRNDIEITAQQGEASAHGKHVQAAQASMQQARVASIAQTIEHIANEQDGDWQRDIVTRFADMSPELRIAVQHHLNMVAVLSKMNDWHAARLGIETPMADSVAQQHLNRKRAAYIVRTIKDFGPGNADVLIAYIWQGVLAYDAADILVNLARARMLSQFRSLPTMSQVLTAQGMDDMVLAESDESWTATAKHMVPNPLSLLQAQRDKQYGNSALKAQERDLPPEFKSALWDVTMRQGETSLAPLHVARAMFDDMTFGVPGGITDLVISTASAGSSIANGEYSIAGEKLQGAMLMVLTAAGIKIYRRLCGAVTGAPVQKTLPAGAQHTMPQYGAGQRTLATGESAAASQAGATEIAGATVLELTQEAAAMSKRLSARFDAVQLDSVAELLRSDPQASVFVREHGEAGIAALAESHGNLANAREVIAKFKTDATKASNETQFASDKPAASMTVSSEPSSSERDMVMGRSSEREFQPALAGGKVRALSTDGIRITKRGIDVVEKHLARFEGPNPANQRMVERLRLIEGGKLKVTQTDLNFYSHEVREYVRYRMLGHDSGDPGYELWNNAHTATLEDYGLNEKTPEVLYVNE
jgi:hypothetical protein